MSVKAVERIRRRCSSSDKKIRLCAFVIESTGGALEEFPEELKGPTPDELYEWEKFDRELEEKIRGGEFCIDPRTGEVKRQ